MVTRKYSVPHLRPANICLLTSVEIGISEIDCLGTSCGLLIPVVRGIVNERKANIKVTIVSCFLAEKMTSMILCRPLVAGMRLV